MFELSSSSCCLGAVAALVLATIGCSGEPSGGSGPASAKAGVVSEAAELTDPSCSSRGGERLEQPFGACTVPKASCTFTTPYGLSSCLPGAQFTAASPTSWACVCAGTAWKCEITGGGFATLRCPVFDAGSSADGAVP